MALPSITLSTLCSGYQWGPHSLTVLHAATKSWKVLNWESTLQHMPSDPLNIKLENIIDIYIRNVRAEYNKGAPMFRLPMGATLPYTTCCCTKNWHGVELSMTKTWPTVLLQVKFGNIINIYIWNGFAKYNTLDTLFRLSMGSTQPYGIACGSKILQGAELRIYSPTHVI